MYPPHRYELVAATVLARLGRRAYRDDGALTTEMMILTAVLSIVAVGAVVILRAKLGDAANNIETDPNGG